MLYVDGPAGINTVSVDYTYDAAGNPLKEINGNDTYAEYSYDNRLHLESLQHHVGGASTAGVDIETDDAGNPTAVSWFPKHGAGQFGYESVYGYDQINRLDEAGFEYNGGYPPSSTTPFTYDWVGNRTGTGWGAVNDVDQLPSDPYGNSYAYDSIYGNLATRTKNSADATFEYDNYNLLKKINWPGSVNTQFVSDSSGNRLSMTTSQGVGYNFIYDVTAGIPAVLLEQTGETNKLYIRTPDGRLIARVTATATPSLDFYYHFDQLGSTIALSNANGSITDAYAYDAWGNIYRHSGSGYSSETQQPYLFVGQLGYYTHYQEPKLNPESTDANKYGMLQLGVRYYTPEIGRFTQRDEIINLREMSYSYASARPTVMTDPTGEMPRINCPGKGQASRIQAALNKICNNINQCDPYTTGPKQRAALRAFCNNGEVQCGSKYCVANPNACGHTNSRVGNPDKSGRCKIYVCLPGFGSGCDTGTGNPEAETILHEIFHCAGSDDPGAECRMQKCIRKVLR